MDKNILGLDFGTTKIGVALCLANSDFAMKLPVVLLNKKNDDVNKITDLIQKNDINLVVIGDPYEEDRDNNYVSKLIDKFIKKISELNPGVAILKWDEAMTSKKAKENIDNMSIRTKYIDSEAARIILQEYIDNLKI